MVLARVIFAPGGSLGSHTHPGTVVATVECGSFGFTHLGDGEMSINRAATAGTEAATEPLAHGEVVILAPGDWFVETGMIHSAKNLSSETTTVVLTGLITTGEPLTICEETAGTPASVTFASIPIIPRLLKQMGEWLPFKPLASRATT
jgi:hypothetical protein